MEFVLHRFNQIGKLFPEQAGSAIGRMTGGNGIDAGALQRLCCLAADGADAQRLRTECEQLARIRKACRQFIICRRAVGKRRSLMGMKWKNIPEQDIPRIESVIQDSTPYVRICRFIHAVISLGAAGHIRRVGTARALSRMAQDHGTGHLLVGVEDHPFTRDGNARKPAALISGGFGDKEITGAADTRCQIFLQLPAADFRCLWAQIALQVIIPPGIAYGRTGIRPE